MFDLLVLGSGIAGLTTALHAASAGMSVLVLTKGELAQSTTRYAQGGVAAALAPPDSPDLHLADTLGAGVGLCDVDAVRVLVTEGPDRVRELAALGAAFDAGTEGLELAREGGHSLARVVHAGGDATGAEIERALVAAARRSEIEVREGWFVLDLITDGGHATGVVALDPSGESAEVRATDIVLTTGGAGQCFAVTTNPALSTGDGIALALRAGVACADLEFVQFHPTALHVPMMPRPLLSEALRGEGAVLRDGRGDAFMVSEHPMADLAPRDVVSRAIAARLRDAGTDHVWLDTTAITDFDRRFPTVWRACRDAGFDPGSDWLPVAPAAHYMSGGVLADLDGATALPRLWVCGEAACSGVHGANRLASNSLLEGLVFGSRVVDAVVGGKREPDETGAMRGVSGLGRSEPAPSPRSLPARDRSDEAPALRAAIQRVMSDCAGVIRDAAGLGVAASAMVDFAARAAAISSRDAAALEVRNLAEVSRAIIDVATAREESRGSHTRADFPGASDAFLGRLVVDGGGSPRFVPLPALVVREGSR